jgi:phage head maturation protease
MQTTTLQIEAQVPSTEADAHTLDFISSDETLDRYDEIISPSGWRLDAYRRNPVFQNAHNYGNVLFTLGKALITEVREMGGRTVLFQRIAFATEVNPVARIAYGLYRGKFLNAVSVGFAPLRWEDGAAAAGDGEARRCRRRYLEQELLEVSAVSIPANPNALQLARSAGAIVAADLRETLELLRSAVLASGPAATRNTEAQGLWELARAVREAIS